jgi:hypothetical protein
MKKILFAIMIFSFFVISETIAGTLIYKVNKEDEKVVSEVKILSIDKKQIVLKVGNGMERIPLTSLIKYYDTDIKIGSAFDDGSCEYDIQIVGIKKPASKTGFSGSKKEKIVSNIEIEYNISTKDKTIQSRKGIKHPHFYLYVLTSDNNNKRKVFVYNYPESAKCNFKNYDEALMMEKALASDRESMFFEHGKWSSNSFWGIKHKFPLEGIKDRKIIATYLIVWGKEKIIYEGGEIWDHLYSINPDWHTRPLN